MTGLIILAVYSAGSKEYARREADTVLDGINNNYEKIWATHVYWN
jgi:hypothetical protein